MRHPLYKSILISTHAPLARCDKTVPQLRLFLSDFYSRTSCEVRQICANKPKKYKGFLLTHLLRGATYEGSFCSLRSQISTHAPLRGATDTCAFPKPQDKISTHAPLRGATVADHTYLIIDRNFYSRASARRDIIGIGIMLAAGDFYSRASARRDQ